MREFYHWLWTPKCPSLQISFVQARATNTLILFLLWICIEPVSIISTFLDSRLMVTQECL